MIRMRSFMANSQERDKLVIKWVRMIQGEAFKRIRGYVYQKKYDQRELIKVGQRNFRKYLASRDWGWFVLIQKTRGLIGRPNPEEELRLLEEKACFLVILTCFYNPPSSLRLTLLGASTRRPLMSLPTSKAAWMALRLRLRPWASSWLRSRATFPSTPTGRLR